MKLCDLRVCNVAESVGFAMDAPVFSWTVEGSDSEQLWASLVICAAGETVYDSGETKDADSLGWCVAVPL